MTIEEVRRAVDSTGDAAFAIDADGVVVAWNEGAVRLLGIRRDAAIGLPCAKLLDGIDECGPVCSENCIVLRSLGERRPLENFDFQVPTKPGRRWCNVSTLRLPTPNGGPQISVHILRMIDVRKRLEMSLQEFISSTMGGRTGALTGAAFASRTPVRSAGLTARQLEVLQLLADGLSVAAIATRLGLRVHTARNHVQSALGRLGAHNRVEALRKATRAGLIHG